MRPHADDPAPGTFTPRAAPAPAAPRVMVWDRAVRAFHWLLVAGMVAAWLSGGSGHRIHEITGFGVAALVGFRLLWGIIGSRHARFGDFVTGPRVALRYAADHVGRHPARHLGHNPAGGYMILALLAAIALISATGIMQLTSRFFGVDWVEKLHHTAADAIWGLVALHVLGALTAGLTHRENLIGSMITGWKPLFPGTERPVPVPVRQRRRQKLEHKRVLARSRQGAPLLAVCVAGGLALGWVSTSGRIRTDLTTDAATTMAATAPATVLPPETSPDPAPVPAFAPASTTAGSATADTPPRTASATATAATTSAAAIFAIPIAAERATEPKGRAEASPAKPAHSARSSKTGKSRKTARASQGSQGKSKRQAKAQGDRASKDRDLANAGGKNSIAGANESRAGQRPATHKGAGAAVAATGNPIGQPVPPPPPYALGGPEPRRTP